MTPLMKPSGINWVGDIPQQWALTKIQFLFEQVKERNVGVKEKNLLSLSYGRIVTRDIEGAFGLIPENYDTYNIIKKGDIVLRLTDMQNDQVSLRTGIVKENRGIITSAYVTLRTRKANSAYYHWYLYAFDITKEIYAFGQGVRQNLTYEELKKMLIPVPDYTEQQAIADFLDEQCAKIDDIAADIEKQIRLLQKYKKSLITETVTKGLDKSAPVKDNGIEWAERVPDRWSTVRMQDVGEYKKGPFGSAITLDMFIDKDDTAIKIYEQKNAINADATLGWYYISPTDYASLKEFTVNSGDIIVSCAGTIGKCYIMPDSIEKGIINQALMRIRLIPGVDKEFFLFLFGIALEYMAEKYSNGSAIKNIPPFSVLKKQAIPLPDVNEQKKIADYLNRKMAVTDEIIVQKEKQLNTIQQHKQSLIHEYVTGKKRVKEVR